MTLPEEDKSYVTKGEMIEQIIHLLGGRVAEKLVLEDISTGASNDIERATNIARNMITRYGMSEKLGPVNYSSEDEVFLGKDFSTRKNYSEEVASEIDHEIKTIIEDAFAKTTELLETNIDKLHTIAQGLLELETLDADQYNRLFNGESLEVLKSEYEEKMKKKQQQREEARKAEAARREEMMRRTQEAAEEILRTYPFEDGGNRGNKEIKERPFPFNYTQPYEKMKDNPENEIKEPNRDKNDDQQGEN